MGILDRFRRGRKESKAKYIIYQYRQTKRSGRWRWFKKAVLEQYADPYVIEDWPSDGYYQMREVNTETGAQKTLWTVYVEGGTVVEEDPELPTNESYTSPTTQQGAQVNPLAQLEQSLQMLAYYRELFKRAGLIKDQKEELMETLMFLREINELKQTAREVIGADSSKLPENAPWWVHLVTPMLQTLGGIASMASMQYNPYMYQQYPPQYQQYPPMTQPQPPQPPEEEIQFNPPSPQEVAKEEYKKSWENTEFHHVKIEVKKPKQEKKQTKEDIFDIEENVDIPDEPIEEVEE